MRLTLYVVGGFGAFGSLLLLIGLLSRGLPLDASPLLMFALWLLFAIPSFGAFWMMYVSARYEKSPFALILLAAFVPFAFLWYYFERVRPRTLPRTRADALRQRSPSTQFSPLRTALLVSTAVIAYSFAAWAVFSPGPHQPVMLPVAAVVFVVHPLGAWWLVYNVVRHEERVFPIILLAVVPGGFLLYYLERVRPTTNLR